MEGQEGADVKPTTVTRDVFGLLLIGRSLMMLVGGTGPQEKPMCVLFLK